MLLKLSVTTLCGAECKTCPVWQGVRKTMSIDKFKRAWELINESPLVDQIFVNSTGDLYELPNSREYLLHIERNKPKWVSITTNANSLDYVPAVDYFVISFNGSNPENYRHTTGLDFERSVGNIRAMYDQLSRRNGRMQNEIDCIVWKGNEGCEAEFMDLWKDFPGIRRVGYKVENQFGEYFGLDEYKDDRRIFCDYLDGLTVAPTGQFIRCAHDFQFGDNYGNIFENSINVIAMHPDRSAVREAHKRALYPGICERCNYNVPIEGKYVYVGRHR